MEKFSSQTSMLDLQNLVETMKEYYQNLESYPCKADPEPGFLRKEMGKMFSDSPVESSVLLKEYMEKCIPHTTHWQSPYYFSFFPANSLPTTVLGEMALSALNEGYDTSGNETEDKNSEIEAKVVSWISKLLKMPDCYLPQNGAHGVIYNTAGDAFLNVALAAKNKKQTEMIPECIVDKQTGYMTSVSNVAVQRSIQFSNLKLRKIE